MNFRLTAGLLIVLIALAGVVYYVEANPATPTPSAKTTPVLSFLASDATGLAASSKQATVELAQGGDAKWLLKRPEEAPADQMRVSSLISELSTLSATRTIDSPTSLADFGLDQPKSEIRITLKSGQVSTLLLGDETPDQAAYYAKLPDKPTVYLIPSYVGGDLEQLLANPPKATPTPTPVTVLTPAPLPSTTPTP